MNGREAGMDEEMHLYDILIVGGGPSGYTAALYGARAGLDTVVLEKLSAGGQMTLTTEIENYPGFDEPVDGVSLGEKMRSSAEKAGAKTLFAEVEAAELQGEKKLLKTGSGTVKGRTVIIAAGAVPKKLGLPAEEELTGRGVHYCAACDGAFYRDRIVAVAGGGNSAAEDALILSAICKKVYLIHRRDAMRAEKIYQERLKEAENVEFLWNREVVGLLWSQGHLTGIRMRNTKSEQPSENRDASGADQILNLDGIFISVGRSPASKLFEGQVTLDKNGYIVADESTKTSLYGVFAAGDIRTKNVRQIVTAVSDGAAAVYEVQKYLQGQYGAGTAFEDQRNDAGVLIP